MTDKIIRGGSWAIFFGRNVRSTYRGDQSPNASKSSSGLRLVFSEDNVPNKTVRGGSWFTDAKEVRCAYRGCRFQDTSNYYVGLRIVFKGEK